MLTSPRTNPLAPLALVLSAALATLACDVEDVEAEGETDTDALVERSIALSVGTPEEEDEQYVPIEERPNAGWALLPQESCDDVTADLACEAEDPFLCQDTSVKSPAGTCTIYDCSFSGVLRRCQGTTSKVNGSCSYSGPVSGCDVIPTP